MCCGGGLKSGRISMLAHLSHRGASSAGGAVEGAGWHNASRRVMSIIDCIVEYDDLDG